MRKFEGELENFPEEVIKRMLFHQVTQGNKEDLRVFEKEAICWFENGGFDWANTDEGQEFWNEVITVRDWDVFFEKYPKKTEEQQRLDEKWEELKKRSKTEALSILIELVKKDVSFETINKLFIVKFSL